VVHGHTKYFKLTWFQQILGIYSITVSEIHQNQQELVGFPKDCFISHAEISTGQHEIIIHSQE